VLTLKKRFIKEKIPLEKNPTKLILIVGLLGILSLLFTIKCLQLIYETAYTTYLSCSGTDNKCIVRKKDIIGEETIQYEFNAAKLADLKLGTKRNVLGQKMYYLTVKNPNTEETYLITGETSLREGQQKYFDEINNFMSFNTSELEFKNPRYKLKFIGLSAAAAGSLIASFLFIDCIGGILRFRKKLKQDDDYQEILNSGRNF